MFYVIAFIVLVTPIALTIWNIVTFIKYVTKKEEKEYVESLEIAAMLLGAVFTRIYIEFAGIIFSPWNKQLYNNQLHSMVAPENFLTIMTCIIIGFVSYYFLRFAPENKQTPLLLALGISGIYIGIAICIIWCVQIIPHAVLIVFPANCILIFIKLILITVNSRSELIWNGQVSIKYKKLSNFLSKSTNLPVIGFILLIPLLGIVVAILFLFGQEPNSMIKAWTETADWTLSQKIAPNNIQLDEHYLCTVAAGGHRKVVKPIRTGIRHDHSVIVNRQLCVANAFEQVLEEKIPKTHKVIRKIYDNTGYPISKHINSKITADIIYFLMKPLEWFFIIILYAVDVHPEDRIAVQYPHKPKPSQ
ncbi:DUF6688 domain-containing protein [Chakrabartyella piscis]|uniref:DUF6688 domain-containing protein n=1 Tax=Chakrabartyella piscis TaxID=2918914 RepID=UPI002958D275|nr:DUF6688 family protein [Chakrabartyella piscis]